MKLSLVIMAAGLGSRYGGNKQVDGIGPHGEILMEYSIYDALRAGFGKVVFIIKPEMREMMEKLVGSYLTQKQRWTAVPWSCVTFTRIFPPYRAFTRSQRGGPAPLGRFMRSSCAEEVVGEPCCAHQTPTTFTA